MTQKRNLTIILVLTFVVLAATMAWIAGSNIKSPAEVAARTAPPTPSPILVPVEHRVLSSKVITRGTARFGRPKSIAIVRSGLKPDAGVITTLPDPGTQFKEGDVLLSASGRPVFVLRGNVPVYRDLVPGISGDDVKQLEQSLKRLGFDPGPFEGIFDGHTSSALSQWYISTGWEPFGATPVQLEHIRKLEQRLAKALNDKLAAADALIAAPQVVEAARAKAARAVKMAEAELPAHSIGANGRDGTAGTKAPAKASLALELAQANITAARLAGDVEIRKAVDAQKQAERQAALTADIFAGLSADLESAREKIGVQLPADEVLFLPSLPVRVEQVDVLRGDRAIGTIMTVTNNELAIDSSLPLDIAPLVKAGMSVAIDEPTLGIKANGVVRRVADTPGTDGVDGYHVYFEVLIGKTSMVLKGFSLRLTIPIETTDGKVIAVPISALSLAADGTSRVQVARNDSLRFIRVEPGLSADGFVEVTPVDGTLEPGELVVIGYQSDDDR